MATSSTTDVKLNVEEERPKKRTSILSPDDDRLRAKKKPMTVRFQDDSKTDERHKVLTSPGKYRFFLLDFFLSQVSAFFFNLT